MELNFSRDGKQYIIRPATLGDAYDVTRLVNICSQDLYGKDELEVGELMNDWQMEEVNLQQDSILLFEDDELIAYADLVGLVPPYVRYPLMARVHPDHKGHGYGWLINRWAMGRVTESLERAPQGTRVFLTSLVHERDQEARQLLEDLGGKMERISWLMERELKGEVQNGDLQEGYSLRVAKPEEYYEFFKIQQEAFRDHWGYIEVPDKEGFTHFLERYTKDPNYQPELFFVAEYHGQIAGILSATASSSYGEDYGWISALGVLPEHRRKGLGKALLLHAFQEMQLFGSRMVGLGVDSQNLTGATGLYEQAGMYIASKFFRYELPLREGRDLRRTE